MSYDISYSVRRRCEHCGEPGEWADDLGYDRNITYNLSRMFSAALPGGLRWLHEKTGAETVDALQSAVAYFHAHEAELRAMAPENGWGTYGGALENISEAYAHASRHRGGVWSVT